MKQKLNIFLVLKTGGDFFYKDVALIKTHLLKHKEDLDIKIYCLTNVVVSPIDLGVVTLLPLEDEQKGWWSKMELFKPGLERYRPFLDMDLDTVILNPYKDVIPTGEKAKGFIMLRDFYRPHTSASGIMWIPANNLKTQIIWKTWNKDTKKALRSRGDQEFLRKIITPDYYWQDFTDKIITFKPNKRQTKILKGDETVMCFHGNPRIWKAAENIKWVKDYIEFNE